jgi:hypothetical protein
MAGRLFMGGPGSLVSRVGSNESRVAARSICHLTMQQDALFDTCIFRHNCKATFLCSLALLRYTCRIKPVASGFTQRLHPTMLVKALASSLVQPFPEGLLGSPSHIFFLKFFEPRKPRKELLPKWWAKVLHASKIQYYNPLELKDESR